MSSRTFKDFRPLLTAKGGGLVGAPYTCLGQERRYSLRYMPFEHTSRSAKIVIVGITPGTTQLKIAYDAVSRLAHCPNGECQLTDAEILTEVKRLAGFGGSMRKNLLRMLSHFRIGPLIGVADEAELWGKHSSALHATSIVPHAAFVGKKMFGGSFKDILGSDLLRGCFEQDFVPALASLPLESRFIALGPTPLEGLEWCASKGYVSADRILGAFAHPSGNGGSQVDVYLGLKKPKDLHCNDPVRHRVPWLLDASARMRRATSCMADQSFVDHTASCTARAEAANQRRVPRSPTLGALPATKPAVGQEPLSRLGLEIEEAVVADPRYIRYRSHAYMCTFRTQRGTVFAFERRSPIAINLWLPPTTDTEATLLKEGIVPVVKAPWPMPGIYGRLSALKSIPELREQPLFVVPARSVTQAMRILTALS